MEDFIRAVSELSGTTVLMLVVFGFVAIKQFYEAVAWAKARLNDWRTEKNGLEKKDESIESRISKLEKRGEWQYTELLNQSAKLDQIVDLIQCNKKDDDAVTIATARATLNTLASAILAKGYLTDVEYDTFTDLSDIYLSKGGNHAMKDKIIPAVKSLPVRKGA